MDTAVATPPLPRRRLSPHPKRLAMNMDAATPRLRRSFRRQPRHRQRPNMGLNMDTAAVTAARLRLWQLPLRRLRWRRHPHRSLS